MKYKFKTWRTSQASSMLEPVINEYFEEHPLQRPVQMSTAVRGSYLTVSCILVERDDYDEA